MRLLLDSHAFLWWLNGRESLGPGARAAMSNPDNEVLVSAATVWEITTKFRIGKLPDVAPIVETLEPVIAAEGFGTLPISVAHAHRAGLLPGTHRDPFDRMLVAQALTDNLMLVSNEARFEQFGVRRVWS